MTENDCKSVKLSINSLKPNYLKLILDKFKFDDISKFEYNHPGLTFEIKLDNKKKFYKNNIYFSIYSLRPDYMYSILKKFNYDHISDFEIDCPHLTFEIKIPKNKFPEHNVILLKSIKDKFQKLIEIFENKNKIEDIKFILNKLNNKLKLSKIINILIKLINYFEEQEQEQEQEPE